MQYLNFSPKNVSRERDINETEQTSLWHFFGHLQRSPWRLHTFPGKRSDDIYYQIRNINQ